MDKFNDLFSVSRKEYTSFVEQLKPNCTYIKTIDLDKWSTAVKVFSIKTNKCLCSRVSYIERTENEFRKPEKYYIFEMPDDDERREPIPKVHLVLDGREEVQAFFNALSKMKKEHEKND